MGGKPVGTRVDLLFDVRHIQQSGIGTYISAFLPFVEETLVRRGRSLTVLADPDTVPPVRDSTGVVLAQPPDGSMYSVPEQRAWSHALKSTRPRAIWLPHYPFPLALLRPTNRRILKFVTVHDALHIQDESISGQSAPRRMYARTMVHMDARMCTNVFTPTQAAATSIRQVAPSAPIVVTPIPMDSVWFTPADPSLCPIDGRYILYVGNVKRHKNLPVLIRAFGEVADAIPHKLVIAGGGEGVKVLDERIPALAAGHGERVHVTGRLDFHVLRSLVAGADLLVMPSLYEGAGLPPLEAMASGTAVLSSDIPPLRETCGDGAEYFDPHNHCALADLIRVYCRDDDARADLATRGWSHVTKRQSEISVAAPADSICDELDKSWP
jgi:glycosyltransferase involved in cell wall biosynthesis